MWRAAWWAYRAVTAVQYRLQRTFTPAGLFVIGAAVLAAVFGVDTNQSLAYKVFTALAALLLVAVLASRFGGARFEARRDLPRAVAVGDAFEYRVSVRNLGERNIEGATLQEDLADPRPTYAEFRASPRLPGYLGWWRMVERNRVASVRAPELPAIKPRAEAELRVAGRAWRRGRLHFTGCTLAITDPLGLVRRGVNLEAPASVLVLPRRYRLPPLQLPGERRYQPGGVTLSSNVGDSEESIGLRDYRPGDPVRRIHWKSFAKRGAPVVHEYQDEFFERHALILDTFAADAGEREFEEAVALAASFAETIDTRECLLDLMFVGDRAYTFTAGRGQMRTEGLLEVLAGVQPCRGKPFRELHDAVLAKRASMSGALCILLAWDEPRRAFIDELRSTGLALRVLLLDASPVDGAPEWLTRLDPADLQRSLAAL